MVCKYVLCLRLHYRYWVIKISIITTLIVIIIIAIVIVMMTNMMMINNDNNLIFFEKIGYYNIIELG